MLAAIDTGNTNLTLGVFDRYELTEIYRLETNSVDFENQCIRLFKELSSRYNSIECIVSSVVKNMDYRIKELADEFFETDSVIFTSDLKTNLNIKTENPKELGKDRYANAICAHEKYPYPAIIVDAGSATTFDILDKNGDFIGGLIMPGINMQFLSLKQQTSLLPLVSPENIDNVIADNTKNSILSGVIRGQVCAIEGLIKECEKELGSKAVLVLTGGLSSYITKYMKRKFDYVDKNLTLNGLKILYELNKR